MTEWVLSSSVLILIVIALRAVFKGKISLRLQYAIWGLVLLRLLMPFSIGSTAISIFNLAENAKEQPVIQGVMDIGNLNIPSQSYEDAYDQVVRQYESQGIDVEGLQGSDLEALEYEAYARMEGVAVSEIAGNIAGILWIAGILLTGAVFLHSNARFRKKLMDSRFDLGIRKGKLSVYATDGIDTPCLFGLKDPAIYLTCEAAENQTLLRHAIAHESTHYRHGDHIWAVLRCVCLAVHWYNPLVWWAAFLSRRDAELACDEATVRLLGERERAEYGRTLIGMTCRKRAKVLLTATTMTTGKGGIRERVLLIARKPRMALYTLVLLILVVAVAAACTFTSAKEDRRTAYENLYEYLEEYSYQQVKERMEREDVSCIDSGYDYALVYCSGEGCRLILYRYEIKGDQIIITDQAEGEYALSGGLSVNHIVDGDRHIYFGTISETHWVPEDDSRIPIDWKDLVFYDAKGNPEFVNPGSEGYLWVMEEPMTDFWVMAGDGSVPLKLEQYLEQGYSIHEATWYSEGGTAEENILLQVLKNKTLFYSVSNDESCTLTEYCAEESERMGLSVSIIQYAFVDMNDDGIQEAVVNFRFGENSQVMCIVLKWDSSSEIVSGTEFYYRQMSQIKEDGSFAYSGGSDNDGWAKLRWENDAWITELVEDSSHKANIQWYSYPMIDDYAINEIVETEAPDDAQPEDLPEVFSEEFDKNKICIAVLPTGISVDGGDYRYIIPENQEVLLEYYTAANASSHEYTQWDSGNLRSGWWIVYQDMWWQVTESGAMFGVDQETSNGVCVDAEDAKQLYQLCDAAVKAAGIGEPVRPEELTEIKAATLDWNGVHTVTDEYALNKMEQWFANSRESGSVSCWFTAQLVLELENGETKTITMATDDCAYYMTEGVAYGFGEITEDGIKGNEEFYAIFAPAVIHDKLGGGMESLTGYLTYLDWSRYANTYGADETTALMDMIENWAGEAPDHNRFGSVIRWSTGLNGAWADRYGAMLARLYELEKGEFAWACLGNASDANEKQTLEMLAYHWNMTAEAVRAKLEADIPQN